MKVSENIGLATLNKNHFEEISRRIQDSFGVKLTNDKEELVIYRLSKRLEALDLDSFDQYLHYVEKDTSGQEIAQMIGVLAVNKTSFFREAAHFDYIRERIFPDLDRHERRLRIWSAACSSGEEPYSIAMLMRESIKDLDSWDARILATDISTCILSMAREGVYKKENIDGVPQNLLNKYFTVLPENNCWRVNDNIQKLIRFGKLNLEEQWLMRGPFDIIFCRNTMIYFDKPTQQKLVHRFSQLLAPGGHLFVEHAESLTGSSGALRYVQPAVYIKD